MDERLKQLMDYTRFHIGMYVTLVSALVVFISKDYPVLNHTNFHYWLLVTIGLFVISGMAGGLIGSSIPDYLSYDEFIVAKLGPWGSGWIRARECAHLEHTTFWLGAVNAVCGLVVSTHMPSHATWELAAVLAIVLIGAIMLALLYRVVALRRMLAALEAGSRR